MGNNTTQASVEGRHRVMLVLWLAFLMTQALFVLICYLAVPPAARSSQVATTAPLFWMFLPLGFILVVISFALERKFFARAASEQSLAHVQTGFIIGVALCESAALFGLCSYFVTHDVRSFFLMALGAIGILAHFPRRSVLLDASYKGQAGR